MQVILYKQQDESIYLLVPTLEALSKYTINQIAEKDVPHNVSFKIVDMDTLPTEPQESWEAPDEWFDSGVGGLSNEFIEESINANS